MKFSGLSELKKKWNEQIPSLLLLVAKEEKEWANKVLSLWSGTILSFDAESFSPSRFLEEMETLPIFEKRRFIHISNVDHLSGSAAEALLAYVKEPNPTATLFLSASNLPQNHKLLKSADETGFVLQIAPEKPWEREKQLVDWLVALAANEGMLLPPQLAKRLITSVGKEEEMLLQELKKVVCYVGLRKQIAPADLDAIVTTRPQETLWQLGEAIFRSDTAASIEIGKTLLEESPFLALLAHLKSQVQTSLEMLAHYEKGGEGALSKAFPYLKGGLLEKKIASFTQYGALRLKQAFLMIVEMEVRAKNSSTAPELLLDILLFRLCRSTYSPTS